MAKSAVTACEIGARGIDINFGCPAKIVNRHDGGSILLREPHRINEIVTRVRDSVDPAIPVSAKIRLGFENADCLGEIVEAIDDAGANALCIHARTRLDGYKPPAYWSHIGKLGPTKFTKLVVNGEIWSSSDAEKARAQSGCRDLMLGRGGLARPDLARLIRASHEADSNGYQAMTWPEIAGLVDQFFHRHDSRKNKYVGNRTKQWLAYLKRQYQGAELLFQTIKRSRDFDELSDLIRQHRHAIESESRLQDLCAESIGDSLCGLTRLDRVLHPAMQT
jgi:tRNA-dihydrouridine synthase C